MSPEAIDFNLTLFSIVTGFGGVLAFLKHLTQSKSVRLPAPRHPFARG